MGAVEGAVFGPEADFRKSGFTIISWEVFGGTSAYRWTALRDVLRVS